MMGDGRLHSFNSLLFLTFVLTVAALAGCASTGVQVERVSVDEQIDLSGAWNDTDSRLVSEEMIQDMLSRAWLLNHARRTGGHPIPANRAAKRTGCFMGSLFLAGAGLALATGHGSVATVLLVMLGSLAWFVGTTGICVPSIVYTLSFGAERGTARRIFGPPTAPASEVA